MPAYVHEAKMIRPLPYNNVWMSLLKSQFISHINAELITNISDISFVSIITVNDHTDF
jgi:hypothetical protein